MIKDRVKRMDEISDEAIDQIFRKARTHNVWRDVEVPDEMLRRLYDTLKWGPTSANSTPARFVFVKTDAAKAKLIPFIAEGNREKTRTAPVTVIVAQDLEFYEHLPRLMPHRDMRSIFAGKDELIKATAFRNSSLQGAYLVIAARALGLDCGPMSGFDNSKVDEAFFAGTTWRSNFLCNLGYGQPENLFPRLPRLDFEEVCRIE